MRDLIIVIAILILVFGGGYWVERYLEGTEKDLILIIDELYEEVVEGDFSHIDKVYELDNMWGNSKAKWHILGNHAEIDEIESEIKRFVEAYKFGDTVEATLSAAEIRFRINDMHKGEKLEIANIL